VEWGCELLGTMLLVLGGVSAVVLDFGIRSPVASALPSHSLRLLLTGLLFAGCGSLVAVSPIGRRSGAHLNPSITVALWCRGHLRTGDALGYVVAQCL
jgi:aquaporin Z